MYNVHPYFSLKSLGKKVHVIHGKIWHFLVSFLMLLLHYVRMNFGSPVGSLFFSLFALSFIKV